MLGKDGKVFEHHDIASSEETFYRKVKLKKKNESLPENQWISRADRKSAYNTTLKEGKITSTTPQK